MDWQNWHTAYDSATSPLASRLRTVQQRIGDALELAAPGPLRAISVCAGQGRDLIGALAAHPRGRDVTARLVELDPRNTAAARADAANARLPGVEAVTGDASVTDAYRGAVPADLVLLCGVFGNITDADIERAIGFLPQLCASAATVVWTRNRREPDRIPLICRWLEDGEFRRVWESEPGIAYGVGVHRFTGSTRPLRPGERMFTFVGYDKLVNGRLA